jgi:hypothetical protein
MRSINFAGTGSASEKRGAIVFPIIFSLLFLRAA